MRGREIVGVENAEDIVLIPGSDWVITGAMSIADVHRPRMFFVNIRTHEMRAAWPDNFVVDLDRHRFGDVEPPKAYSFHGLDVIQRGSAIEVYAVNHSPEDGPSAGQGRESVEIFEVDLLRDGPSLRWRGAALGPVWLGGNDLCALPEGGFAITNFCYPGPEAAKMGRAGGICGNVLEWRNRDEGWVIVPGTDLNFPNGIALAPAGDAYFVASWGTRKVVRVPRADARVSRAEIPMEGMIDNITWTPDGALLCCVQIGDPAALFAKVEAGEKVELPFQAVRLDPVTLETRILVADEIPDFFATTVLQIGEREVWASAVMGNRLIAYDL
jgi:hypothetical protein